MNLDDTQISLGVYSPSLVFNHLLREYLESTPNIQLIIFEQEQAFLSSQKKKQCHGYLRDPGSHSQTLFFYRFAGNEEKKDTFLKPFRLSVLLDKLDALAQGQGDCVEIGSYGFYPKHRLLKHNDGTVIPLREKEADFLLFLLKSPGQKAERQVLLQQVWRYTQHAKTHTLETHVYHLRQKIESNPATPEILLNEGTGYRLVIAS